jgi:glycine/D-amino acid oxidase-like deaminating enzyme
MDTTSVWRATATGAGFAMLQDDVQCDVLVVGGGITGVTTALLLAQQGRKVVLLEADEIGGGTTGHSTGNLYVTTTDGISSVVSAWDETVAREVVQQRKAAIDFIEQQCRDLPNAHFTRCPLVLWSRDLDGNADVESEQQALARLDCQARLDEAGVRPGLPQPRGPVMVLEDQAQFQPQAYTLALAQRAAKAGASLHEHSRVIELDAKARVATTATGSVKAAEIVLATHSPKGVHLVHAEMPVHREYVVAFEMGATDPGPGIFWWSGEEGLSIRTLAHAGRRYVIAAGPEQKVGVHNAKASLLAVETLATQMLQPGPTRHRWSAQNYRSHDGLPYIGRDHSGCFIATGFSTDGLTWAAGCLRQAVRAGALHAGQGRKHAGGGEPHDRQDAGEGLPDALAARAPVVPRARRQRDRGGRRRDLRGLPRARWRAVRRLTRVHAHGLQGALEQRRDELGLPVPRKPVPPRWDGRRRAGAGAAAPQARPTGLGARRPGRRGHSAFVQRLRFTMPIASRCLSRRACLRAFSRSIARRLV